MCYNPLCPDEYFLYPIRNFYKEALYIMKKLTLFILSAMLILCSAGLSSCGNAEADTDDSSGATNETVNETADEAAADTGAENDNTASDEKVAARVFAFKGPTGMGMTKLMADDEDGTATLDYDFTLVSAPDEVTAEIIKGNYDIAALPTNLASVLYNKTDGNIRVAAVNTLGVLYILENGDTVSSVEDLHGKQLYATGQASTPEYILNYILDANGIDDCEVIYLADHSELAAQMTSGDVTLGMLPVPNATTVMAGTDAHAAIDMTEEWKKAAEIKGDDSALYQGCIVINPDFISAHPEAVADFLDEYSESVDYVNNNIDDASALMEKYGIIPKAAVAKLAIPDANIVCITGDEMANGLSGFYKVLFDFNPASVGGSLPGDDIFYKN